MNDLETIASELWRVYPDTYAQVLSNYKWKRYRHLEYLSNKLLSGIINGGGRYVVTIGPRHGKSEFISNWLPTWYLDIFPNNRIILASYAAKFAAKWGRKVRTNLESNRMVLCTVRMDSRSAERFDLWEGGGMITAGVGGPITGEGANLLIIDDPIKNWKEATSETTRKSIIDWFNSTAYTRLEPNATIIVLMTRWHEEDLAGYLINDHEDDWELINFPAIAEQDDELGRTPGEALCPERYDEQALEKIKLGVGVRVWNGLYQQRPAPEEGEHWRRSDWRFYTEIPKNFDEIIQSWDMTFKDKRQSKSGKVDWVVGQVWGRLGRFMYLLDQVRGQWGFTKSMEMVMQLSLKWPLARRKLIENKANGPAIEDALKETITGIRLVEPQGGKVSRVTACEPTIQSGHVLLPDPKLAAWVQGFIDEAASFGPTAKHDDQVDTASQAILFLDRNGNSFLQKIINK